MGLVAASLFYIFLVLLLVPQQVGAAQTDHDEPLEVEEGAAPPSPDVEEPTPSEPAPHARTIGNPVQPAITMPTPTAAPKRRGFSPPLERPEPEPAPPPPPPPPPPVAQPQPPPVQPPAPPIPEPPAAVTGPAAAARAATRAASRASQLAVRRSMLRHPPQAGDDEDEPEDADEPEEPASADDGDDEEAPAAPAANDDAEEDE